jgi:outer membrane protein OmpA-like peptidoglycan-associated protein
VSHSNVSLARRSAYALPGIIAALALAGCSAGSPSAQPAARRSPGPPPPAAAIPPPPAPPPAAAPVSSQKPLSHALDALNAQNTDRGRVVSLPSAHFRGGQTTFRPVDSSKFEQIVALLRDYPEVKVLVEGYTDSRGSERANMRISAERADAVRDALIARGIAASRVRTKGMGEARPIANNSTSGGREQNRRTDLVLSDAAGNFQQAG